MPSSDGVKLADRINEKKNKYQCTCTDPTVALGSGRVHHVTGCVRKSWAYNADMPFKPQVDTTVQMMQTAGSQAGMWYKYNGKTWALCEPPPSV